MSPAATPPLGEVARRFWRVPVVAGVAAALAFLGSFLVAPVYASSTQLLVRGRDATFLTATGQNLANQPGVVDATLARALGETQGALLGSRTVARMVVDRLDLEKAEPAPSGVLARLKSAVGGGLGRAKAILVHGTYAEPSRMDRAVEEVHAGLSARQLRDSYVLDLVASAGTPEQAVAIANAAADALLQVSRERFRTEAAEYRDFLAAQLERAAKEQAAATEEIRQFKESNGIDDVGVEVRLSAESKEKLRVELQEARVAEAAARAELAAVTKSLAQAPPTNASESRIETGRSTTRIAETGASSVYSELQVAKSGAESRLAAQEARRKGLAAALDPRATAGLNAEEAGMRELELRAEVAGDSFRTLSARHQEAVTNSDADRVEVTRVDTPSRPSYPVSPKRYLYLGLGGITGALAGLVLTALAAWKRGEPLLPWLAPAPAAALAPATTEAPTAELPAATHARPGAVTPTDEVSVSAGVLAGVGAGPVTTRSSTGPFEIFSRSGTGAAANGHTGAPGRTEREKDGTT